MTTSTEKNLRLPGAKSALAAMKSQSGEAQIDPTSAVDNGGAEDADKATPAEDSSAIATGHAGVGLGAVAKEPDRSKLLATITKSWVSGGVAGTGRDRVQVDATYPATKDIKTGSISLGSDSFTLTVTDLNTKVSSKIERYLFSNTEWTEIPVPDDADNFDVRGNVKIDVQTSGKMMRVRFHVNTGSHLSDIGYIFLLDIPESTKFVDATSSEPSS
jgi:hypothetical protein